MGLVADVITIGVVIILAFLILGTQLSAKAGKRTGKIISNIDKKYEQFIKKRLTLSILEKTDFNFDTNKIKEEVRMLLRPDIEALISHIIATKNVSDVKINNTSKYFQNLVSLSEKYFVIMEKRENKNITLEEREEFYKALNSSVDSDLTKRILDLKMQNA